jgi:hypothetical protein
VRGRERASFLLAAMQRRRMRYAMRLLTGFTNAPPTLAFLATCLARGTIVAP